MQGKATLTAAEPSRSATVKVSPDGKRAALVRTDPQNNVDVWIVDLVDGSQQPAYLRSRHGRECPCGLPTGARSSGNPCEAVVGESIGKHRTAREMTSCCTSRTAVGTFALTDWTRDGRFILFQASNPPDQDGYFRAADRTGYLRRSPADSRDPDASGGTWRVRISRRPLDRIYFRRIRQSKRSMFRPSTRA